MIELNSAGQLTAKVATRIPFHDIDPAGVAWHGRYFKYLELARIELLEDIDYSYTSMLASGFLWPVAESKIRYVHPLLLEQKVSITAWLKEWEMRLVVDYTIHNNEGVLCTKARTIQVPVCAKSHELQFGCPEVLIENVNARLAQLDKKAI